MLSERGVEYARLSSVFPLLPLTENLFIGIRCGNPPGYPELFHLNAADNFSANWSKIKRVRYSFTCRFVDKY